MEAQGELDSVRRGPAWPGSSRQAEPAEIPGNVKLGINSVLMEAVEPMSQFTAHQAVSPSQEVSFPLTPSADFTRPTP